MKNKLKILFAAFSLTLAQTALSQMDKHIPKAKPADKVIQALQDRKKYVVIELIKDPNSEFYLIKTEINGKTGYFLLDTGAYTTALTMEGAKALKLKLNEEAGTSWGMGGASKNYSANIEKLVFASVMQMPIRKIKVLNIPALSKGDYRGAHPMGILGSDILASQGIVVDFQTDKLYYPMKKKFKLSSVTRMAGYTTSKFIKGENVPTVSVQVGKRTKMKMVLDSGAKTTVIDLSAAKSSKLKITKSTLNLQGAGANTLVAKTVYIPKIKFAGSTFTSFASSAVQLRGKVKNIDGIIGAELLFSSGIILDYGAESIYTKKKLVKAYELGVVSKLALPKKASKALVTQATKIYDGHIVGLQPDGDMKGPDGKLFSKLKLTLLVGECIKGEAKEGEKITFSVVVPAGAANVAELTKQIRAENERLVILSDSPVHTVAQCLFKTSSVRTGQVKRLMTK